MALKTTMLSLGPEMYFGVLLLQERLGRRRKEGSKRGEIKYIFFLTGIYNDFTRIILLFFIISFIKHFYTVDTDLTTVNGYTLFLHKHTILSDQINGEAGRRLNQSCKNEKSVCVMYFCSFLGSYSLIWLL